MLPQPGTGSPSTDALSQIMRGRQWPMGGDPGQGIGVGDGPMPQQGIWQSSPTEGIAPPPGEAMWHSSPTEGVAPPAAPAAPIGSSSPTEGVMTNRDPAAPVMASSPTEGVAPAATEAAPHASSPYGLGGMARRGRRHMMHGGGGMSGTPALAGLHSLINGFGQGGY